MKIHYLKTLQPYFNEVKSGNKTFELRKNDRDFKVGDILKLQEFINDKYTGKKINMKITYILNGGLYGLDKDYCILGIKKQKYIYWNSKTIFSRLINEY